MKQLTAVRASAALLALAASSLPGVGLAADCPAASAEVMRDRVARMDVYFGAPQSPVVYRALAGRGDPQIQARNAWDPPTWTDADMALLARLFPTEAAGQDRSWATYGVGACRLGEALAIFHDRVARLGANHPYVVHWILAQQAVFSSCRGSADTTGTLAMPPPLELHEAALSRLQAEDRAYQQASIQFYNGQPLPALAAFQHIAASRSSYRPVARYMVVAIRAGSRGGDGAPDKPLTTPAQSLREVQALIADPTMASVRPIAEQLIGWLAYNNGDDDSGRAEVTAVLKALNAPQAVLTKDAAARDRYARALADVDDIHATFPDPAAYVDGAIPDGFPESRAMAQAAKTDPLAAWAVFPASRYHDRPWALHPGDDEAGGLNDDLTKRAGENADDPTNPWVHEALMVAAGDYQADRWAWIDDELKRVRTCGDDAAVAALPIDVYHQVRSALMAGTDPAPNPDSLDAALAQLKSFPLKDAGFYTATVHDGLQYLMAVGRISDARRLRDTLGLDTAPAAATNDPTDLLAILAEDEDHLVKTLRPAAYEEPALLNQLSIAALERLARRTDVPPEDRSLFARTAWTRTYALGRPVDPSLDALMRSLNPEVVKDWKTPAGKPVRPDDHTALMDVLASPALNLPIGDDSRRRDSTDTGLVALVSGDDNDDNWWCAFDPQRSADLADDAVFTAMFGYGDETIDERRQLRPAVAASFLHKASDPDELAALSKVDQAPKLLTERTIAWVEHTGAFGGRTGQDEALALAVRTTRWGCNWQGRHGAYSHKAYLLLHSLFPASEAAKRTRYWFDCVRPCPAPDPAPAAPPSPSAENVPAKAPDADRRRPVV